MCLFFDNVEIMKVLLFKRFRRWKLAQITLLLSLFKQSTKHFDETLRNENPSCHKTDFIFKFHLLNGITWQNFEAGRLPCNKGTDVENSSLYVQYTWTCPAAKKETIVFSDSLLRSTLKAASFAIRADVAIFFYKCCKTWITIMTRSYHNLFNLNKMCLSYK